MMELSSVTLNDPALGGAITLLKTTLAPGEKTTATKEYKLTQADIDAGSKVNTATVTGKDRLQRTVQDTDDATVTLAQTPAINIVKDTTTPSIANTKPGENPILRE